jgi:hypothetical protein
MYSATKFSNAKIDLAYSILHQKNADHMGQVEIAFLRHLLSAAAQRGQVTPDDIYCAVEQSGAFDLDLGDDEKDKIVADLWNIGDNYLGALSARQAAELRNLRKLCLRAVERGDAEALSQIAELI